MNIIREIEEQYNEIEKEYARKQFEAYSRGNFRKEAYWQNKRELNIHAYFLFLFTRLEDHIKIQTTALIVEKKTNISHWKTRAIWDITDEDNLHFKKRVSLLTKQGNADYNKIIDYYKHRNTIAHGGTIVGFGSLINMMDVFNDMKRYFKVLKK